MKEFSFSDLIDKLIGSLWAGIGAVFDWFKKLFTDPVGAILSLATGIADMLVGIGKWVYNTAIKPIWEWIKGIFGFDSGDEEGEEESGGLLDWVMAIPGKIWGWIKGIFTFTTPEGETVTLWSWLKSIPGEIWGWIKGIFSFTKTNYTRRRRRTNTMVMA